MSTLIKTRKLEQEAASILQKNHIKSIPVIKENDTDPKSSDDEAFEEDVNQDGL